MISIVAIVPFSLHGGDEVLLLSQGGAHHLPGGTVVAGERVFEAVQRIVHETTGLRINPLRVVYLLEDSESELVLGVVCDVPSDDPGGHELIGVIAPLSEVDDFRPMALREVLLEDLRSGFVRPVAHIIEPRDGDLPGVIAVW